jgi:hypothetical protein
MIYNLTDFGNRNSRTAVPPMSDQVDSRSGGACWSEAAVTYPEALVIELATNCGFREITIASQEAVQSDLIACKIELHECAQKSRHRQEDAYQQLLKPNPAEGATRQQRGGPTDRHQRHRSVGLHRGIKGASVS